MDLLVQWAGWLLAAGIGVFAIRTTIRFDVNEWQKERRKRQKEQLRSLCPHADITYHEGEPAVRSTFISPPGTVAYKCQDCGYTTHDRAWLEQHAANWAKNPNELIEREKQIERLTKKYLRI